MKKYIGIILIISLIWSNIASAGWLQTYVDNFKAASPATFKTAARTSYAGGGVSLRMRPRTDPLFSIEPPRIKAGCGGIDLYMGSFAYLNPEYLLDKMKKILKMAPAAAFQLALGVLCDPCKNVMNTMEQIAQAFNALQLDECAASKALVAVAASPFVDDPQKQGSLQNTISDFMSSTGVETFKKKINDSFSGTGKTTNPDTTRSQLTQGCSNNFKNIYFSGSSLLSNLFKGAKYENVFSNEIVDILRGWVGDLKIEVNNNADGFKYTYISPCLNKTVETPYDVVSAITMGDFQKKTNFDASSCTDVKLDNGKTMYQYVSENLQQIMDNMKNKTSGSYTADQMALILTPGVPVPLLLKHASYIDSYALKKEIAEVVSEAIVLSALEDSIGALRKMISVALEVASKEASKQTVTTDSGASTCNVQLAGEAIVYIEKIKGRVDMIEAELFKYRRDILDERVKSMMTKIDLGRRLEVQLREQFLDNLKSRKASLRR